MFPVEGVAPADPGVTRRLGQSQGLDGVIGVRKGQGFGLLSPAQGGSGLALCQTVDLIGHHHIGHVHIAPSSVNEVTGPIP